MKVTTASLIRTSGLSAMLAGIIFAAIQPIHPADVLASVTTNAWATIMLVKLAMCLFFLFGITGLYARQVRESGWLGLVGYLMLALTWVLQTAYIFAEAAILPVLTTASPEFVESFLGIFNGAPGDMNIGALPAVYNLVGLLYMLGGVLFGVAILRARVLPRWAAVLLAVASAVTPAAALLPHQIQRLAGIPVGIAIAWLGLALLAERREIVSLPSPEQAIRQPHQVGAA